MKNNEKIEIQYKINSLSQIQLLKINKTISNLQKYLYVLEKTGKRDLDLIDLSISMLLNVLQENQENERRNSKSNS